MKPKSIKMQMILSMIILLLSFNRLIFGEIVLADFQQQALERHNYFRALHCTGPMILNATISAISQSYAEYLAANDLFEHSTSRMGTGENLYGSSSSAVYTFINGSSPVNAWYNEIAKYSFSSPGYSDNTGHFTQVVWKASTQLGIGIALTSNKTKAKVVANYYRAGNLQGAFVDNVLSPCSTTSGGD